MQYEGRGRSWRACAVRVHAKAVGCHNNRKRLKERTFADLAEH